MKSLLLALAAIFITVSQADAAIRWPCGASKNIDENSTWEEIDKSLAVKGAYPMVQINGHFITVDWLCHDEANDMIVSKRAIAECLENETNERGDCIKWAGKILSRPRVTDKKTIALDYRVDVITNSSSTSCSAKLFVKDYSMDKCDL
ncbi:MAG: hypothetical protein H6624_15395 [Bdellovibrionaceae bacterium]|nr:hypothetical protein [Bdellovibrionales bacterium]MCB9085731.1 hypothetical protein [Pseudobdellovibrionaceae bacterium]